MSVDKIRDLEQLIIANPKNTKELVRIVEFLDSKSKSERLASLHSLRRIFIEVLESKRLSISNSQSQSVSPKDSAAFAKYHEYKKWFVGHLDLFKERLCAIISQATDDVKVQSAALRTLVELVKREYMYTNSGNGPYNRKVFGTSTYEKLLDAVLTAPQMDVDLLLLVRSEVFIYADCSYHALLHIHRSIRDELSQAVSASDPRNQNRFLLSNALDLLRIISVPKAESLTNNNATAYLVPTETGSQEEEDDDNNDDSDEDGDDENDFDYYEQANETEISGQPDTTQSLPRHDKYSLTPAALKKRKRDAELLAQLSNTTKSKKQLSAINATNNNSTSNSKNNKSQPTQSRLKLVKYHKRAFARAWTALLASPRLSLSQHKLILKHLPQHLIIDFPRPILLADYLSRCYSLGGIIAVLALESLFELIVKHNLDHPHFFESLYRLCNPEVFSAKYKGKFMKLLSVCLTSSNLPVYTVASFIKRLAKLSLIVPSTSALFCVAQVTWLLREHPECLVLLHRDQRQTNGTGGKVDVPMEFDDFEETDLQRTNALESSLWEIEALKYHYSSLVSDMAIALENTHSTMKPTKLSELATRSAPPLRVGDFLSQTYETLVDTELKKTGRKQAPLAVVAPGGLWEGTVTSTGKAEGNPQTAIGKSLFG